MGTGYTVEDQGLRVDQTQRLEDITGRRGWCWVPAKGAFGEYYYCPFVDPWMIIVLKVPNRAWYVLVGKLPGKSDWPLWMDSEHITLAEDCGSPETAMREAMRVLSDNTITIGSRKSK